jgi:hypothetical protein
MEPIIVNDKEERIYSWLLAEVGQPAIDEAIKKLAGNRKPYLSNIVKILGLKIPKSVLNTPSHQARQHLDKLMNYINIKK